MTVTGDFGEDQESGQAFFLAIYDAENIWFCGLCHDKVSWNVHKVLVRPSLYGWLRFGADMS